MADTFGDSFSPLQPPGGLGGPPNGSFGGGSASPIQDAIKVLSLRIPRVAGASALAPMGLLNSPGGSMFGGGGIEALLRQIFGRARGGPVASMPMPPDTPGAARPGPVGPPNVAYTPPETRTAPDGGPQLAPPAGPSMPLRPPDRLNRGRL